jgi:hypothetical protein
MNDGNLTLNCFAAQSSSIHNPGSGGSGGGGSYRRKRKRGLEGELTAAVAGPPAIDLTGGGPATDADPDYRPILGLAGLFVTSKLGIRGRFSKHNTYLPPPKSLLP